MDKPSAIERHLRAANAGYEAASKNIPASDNPYNANTIESEAWLMGRLAYLREERLKKSYRDFIQKHSTRKHERGNDGGTEQQ